MPATDVAALTVNRDPTIAVPLGALIAAGVNGATGTVAALTTVVTRLPSAAR